MSPSPRKTSIGDVYDDAIQHIIDTVASSRLTKAPISISRGGFSPNITGTHQKPMFYGPGQIRISLGTHPDYDTFNRVLHHEDIHEALKNEDIPAPLDLIDRLNESISGHRLVQAVKDARYNWDYSNRAGFAPEELPAYSGSYERGKIIGQSPDNAADYVQAVKRFISPASAANYQRIVDNINLAKR